MIRKKEKKSIKPYMLPFLLIFPALIFALVFRIYPIVFSFVKAFQYKDTVSFETYRMLFADINFWKSMWITLKMNFIMIPLQIVISFVLALLVSSTMKGIGIFRSIFYIPVTISMSVAAICWSMILSVNNGVMNSILQSFFGMESQGFFTDEKQAMMCIILLCTWKGCGYWMMFYLAGLKEINTSVMEAAKIDGAGYFQRLFYVVIPLLKKTTLFITVANTSINLLLFAPIQLITSGGPNDSTNVLMYNAYQQAFKYGNYSKGSAITSILVVIILVVVYVQFYFMNEKE